MTPSRAYWTWAIAASSVVVALTDVAWAERDYTVVAGDDCTSISITQLGSRSMITALHKANPQLGKTPHKLVPGQILKIPEQQTSPDAQLSNARGAVRVRDPKQADWNNGQKGTDLFRAWRVNTQTQATAEITFKNTSQIEMRENTVVIIYGSEATNSKIELVDVELETGALRSRLGQLAGKPVSANVVTPSSQISGLGAEMLIAVDQGGRSTIANHGKANLSVRSKSRGKKPSGAPVNVVYNYGTRAEVGKPVEAPRPLPPAPQWTSTSTNVLIASPDTKITGAWTPVSKAVKYRVQIAGAATNTATVIEVPSTASAFELQGAAPDRYIISVATIDAEGFESIASAPLTIGVQQVAGNWLGDGKTRAAKPALALGETIDAKSNSGCTIDDTGGLRIVTTGAHVLRCGDAQLAFETPAVVVTNCLNNDSPQSNLLAIGSLSVMANTPTNIGLCVAGGPVSGQVSWQGDSAVSVGAVQNNGAVTPITATANGTVRVLLNGDIVLAQVQVIANMPPPPPPARMRPLPRYELGLGIVGQVLLSGKDHLLPPSIAAKGVTQFDRAIGLNALLAARLPYRLGVEASLGVATLTTKPVSEDAQIVNGRLGGSLRLWSSGDAHTVTSNLELRLTAGIGLRVTLDDAELDGYVDVGAAALWHFSDQAGLRIDVRDVFVNGEAPMNTDANIDTSPAQRGELVLSLYRRLGK